MARIPQLRIRVEQRREQGWLRIISFLFPGVCIVPEQECYLAYQRSGYSSHHWLRRQYGSSEVKRRINARAGLRKSKPKSESLQLLVRVRSHRQALEKIQAGMAGFDVIQLGSFAGTGCDASMDFADVNKR